MVHHKRRYSCRHRNMLIDQRANRTVAKTRATLSGRKGRNDRKRRRRLQISDRTSRLPHLIKQSLVSYVEGWHDMYCYVEGWAPGAVPGKIPVCGNTDYSLQPTRIEVDIFGTKELQYVSILAVSRLEQNLPLSCEPISRL